MRNCYIFLYFSHKRIAAITSGLQSRLEEQFQEAVAGRDRERLAHCLQAYSSISRQEDAETMFQSTVVHPFLDKVSWLPKFAEMLLENDVAFITP